MRRVSLIGSFLLAGLPVMADVTSPSGRTVECYCTDRTGSRVELGEFLCMQVDGRMFMAQCQMSLNSPMWREIAPGCLSSSVREFLHGPQSVNPGFDTLSVHPEV